MLRNKTMKPSKELEQEIMEYVFSEPSLDHRACMKQWMKNPWEAVSLYEIAVYPEYLDLPLALPTGVKGLSEEEELERAVEAFMKWEPVVETEPRAAAGEYELDNGKVVVINKFGRITNGADALDDEE